MWRKYSVIVKAFQNRQLSSSPNIRVRVNGHQPAAVHGAMGCGKEAVPPAPVRLLVNCDLSRVSRQSRLSANDKGDN